MKRFIAMLLALLMVLSLAACGQEAAPAAAAPAAAPAAEEAKEEAPAAEAAPAEMTMSLLRLGDIVKAEPIFTPIVESYVEKNPNITLNFDAMSWSEATTKLKLLGAQGQLPDVMFINIINGWDLADSGYLTDLMPYIQNSELKNDIPQAVLDVATTADGALYWVPAALGAWSMWYNKDVFEQAGLDPECPPTSMEEFLEYGKIITEKTGIPGIGWGLKALEDLANEAESFYSSYTGADVWDDGNKVFTFEDNEENRAGMVAVLEFMKEVTDSGATQANPAESSPYDIRPLFRDGGCGMYLDGVWAVKEFSEELNKGDEETAFHTALFPAGPAGSHPILGCDGWAIPSVVQDADQSWDLVEHIMSSDNQTRHATLWGLLPFLNSENGKEEFSAAFWGPLMEQVATVSSRPKDKNVALIEQTLADATQAVCLGQMTAEDAVDYMIDTVHASYVD